MGLVRGSQEGRFPSYGKSLGSIRSLSPFPLSCSSESLLLGRVFTLPLRGSWFKSAPSSHLEQRCLLPLIPLPPAQPKRILSVVVEAVMGLSGLRLLDPWGGNRVMLLGGERESKVKRKNTAVDFNLPHLELLYKGNYF